jgi:transposase
MALADETPFRDDVRAAASAVAIIETLQAENALLRSENAALTARLAELERRLGLNSSNSGKVAGHILVQPLDQYVRGRFRPA